MPPGETLVGSLAVTRNGGAGLGPVFAVAGGNCVGALLGGLLAARFGITAPYWVGLVVAIGVSAATWRVFNRAAVARAYADPPPVESPAPVG